MKTITIHDAKTNLSKYIKRAKEGEKIYIGGFGKPEVMLVAAPEPQKRDFSKAHGLFHDYDQAFTPETEEEITKLLLGE